MFFNKWNKVKPTIVNINRPVNLKEFVKWIYNLCNTFGSKSAHKNVIVDEFIPEEDKLTLRINTSKNSYELRADGKNNYLGCSLYIRNPQSGFGGYDLPEGDLSLKTWNEILSAILANEMEYTTQMPYLFNKNKHVKFDYVLKTLNVK